MQITINEKKIQLKKTFRSLIAYESAMGKTFNPTTITESIMYFYCVIIASDMELELTYDEFMDWLDDNPTALQDFTEWLIEQNTIESKLSKKKTVRANKKA